MVRMKLQVTKSMMMRQKKMMKRRKKKFQVLVVQTQVMKMMKIVMKTLAMKMHIQECRMLDLLERLPEHYHISTQEDVR